MGDEHVPALMAAYAVAMSAKSGQLTEHAVEDMRIKAEEVLLRDHPAYPVIVQFATMYEMERHDPAALAQLGEALELGIRMAVQPASADRPERVDLDG